MFVAIILSVLYMYTWTSVIFSSHSPLHPSLSLKPFLPARPHSIFLSPLWVWPTEFTYSGLQETDYSENWAQVPCVNNQCLPLTTEPSLLHQVKCFKCHEGSCACRFCIYLHTGRLHILCQEPLTCLLIWLEWAPHSAVCLWVNSPTIKQKAFGLWILFFWCRLLMCFWAVYVRWCSVSSCSLFWDPENTYLPMSAFLTTKAACC